MTERPSEAFLPGAQALRESPRALPMLRAVDVHKSHGRARALRGLSLEVAVGEALVLFGPAGGGKTTFLRCVDHLDRVDAGWIYVQGALIGYDERDGKLREQKPREVAAQRRDVGFVFGDGNLFPHLSVLGNLTVAPRRAVGARKATARDAARAMLDSVGLGDLERALPGALTPSQRRRAAIARALVMEPKLLLLDEPTAGLAPESADEVLAVIRALSREGLTMVIASADPRFLREVATTAAFLHEGVVLEKSAAQDMLLGARDPRAAQFVDALA